MPDNELERCAALLEHSEDYRVVRRFAPVDVYYSDTGEEKLIGIYVDVETTGLNPGTDKIIELAMVSFEFLPDGRIFRILDRFDQFEDPGFPIPEGIVALTGITDAMVQGKQIDKDMVRKLVDQASVVIAHNAHFDRTFLESSFPVFEKKAWACSIHDIPWMEEGIEGVKLEFIAYRLGFFYDGHRAITDCLAGVHILSKNLPKSEVASLKALLDNARQNEYRIWAEQSPYDAKDILRARGYRWNNGDNNQPRSWYLDIAGEKLKDEITFLHQQIYGRDIELRIDLITAFDRYTARTKLISFDA